MYSRFSISMGSTSVDSTNHQLEIFEKIPEISERQTLNLPHTGIYFSVGIVSGIIS